MSVKRMMGVGALSMLAAAALQPAPTCPNCGQPVGGGKLDQEWHALGRCAERIAEQVREQAAQKESRSKALLDQQAARITAVRADRERRRLEQLRRDAEVAAIRIDRAKAKRERKARRGAQ